MDRPNEMMTMDRAPREILAAEPGALGAQLIAQGAALQRVQTAYATAVAVQRPRVLAQVERQVMREAAMLGDDGFYGWGAGRDRIEGPSKHLALSVARCWGNCAVDLAPVQETPEAWIFSATFVDLETGFTLARQFRQSRRWTVHGRFDDERKDDVRFQIGQSKAIRNVILNALPQWLVSRALDVCRGGVRAKLEARIKQDGLAAVQDAAIARLEALGVPAARVLAAFGRHAPSALTIEDLVTLAGSIRAIETGSDTIDAIFPPKRAELRRDAAASAEAPRPAASEPADEAAAALEAAVREDRATHDGAKPSRRR